MSWRGTVRGLLAAGMLSAVCWAQSSPAKPAPAASSSDAPCPATQPSSGESSSQGSSQTPAKPCAAQSNSTPKSIADQFPFPGEAEQPGAPAANAPTPNAPHPSAASQHPFPGEPPAADSGSSSSDSSSSSSSDDDNYDPNAPLPSTLKKPLPKPKAQTADQRVDEDLRVSKFYMDNDNLAGAYLRAKDAVRVEPDYSETHFMLGQVLEKMKKKDEAIAEYKAYLKMDPDGDRVKTVKKALDELK